MAFFQHINYAASHEDGRSELRALALSDVSRVLCITGSGSRVLDLLVARPREVVAIDLNPAQTHLLALKIAAMRALDYDAYVRFIGLVPDRKAPAHYAHVRTFLTEPARTFWDGHQSLVRRGVLYCGRWERFLRLMVAPAAFARRALIRRVFACASVAEQQELWLGQWNTPGWDRYLRVIANRFVWSDLVREPGMSHIPRELDIAACIRGRFDRAAGSYLFRESPWAWLVFHGYLPAQGPLPPHLSRQHFETLRASVGAVVPVTGSLLSYLDETQAGRFTAFSVSDFGSYANAQTYEATWHALGRAAAPDARVCERQFLVPRDPSLISGVNFVRDRELEQELVRKDNSVVYDLLAGTLTT